jgi:hypothetical protein
MPQPGSALPRPLHRAGERGVPAAASAARASPGDAPWRRRERRTEEGGGRWDLGFASRPPRGGDTGGRERSITLLPSRMETIGWKSLL